MIERLKLLIDHFENTPAIKSVLLKVAELPEEKQNDRLELILKFIELTK